MVNMAISAFVFGLMFLISTQAELRPFSQLGKNYLHKLHQTTNLRHDVDRTTTIPTTPLPKAKYLSSDYFEHLLHKNEENSKVETTTKRYFKFPRGRRNLINDRKEHNIMGSLFAKHNEVKKPEIFEKQEHKKNQSIVTTPPTLKARNNEELEQSINEIFTAPKLSDEIPFKDFPEELAGDTKQTIRKKIYSEPKGMMICWKSILYANETSEGLLAWDEFQIVFHFPGAETTQEDKDETAKKVEYGIKQENGQIIPQEFNVIEERDGYKLSKRENISCGYGNFMSKAYYDWPGTDKKKIVLRLTEKYSQILYKQQEEADDEMGLETNIVAAAHKTNDNGEEANNAAGSLEESKGLVSARSGETSEEDPEGTTVNNISNEQQLHTKVFNSVDPCSPILTKLLSGTGVLPGLCNLQKDESVLLQGTILVSKKYINSNNQTEVVTPMFVIRENTEIEATRQPMNNTVNNNSDTNNYQ